LWSLALILLAGSGGVAYAAVSTNFFTAIINNQASQADYTLTANPASQGVIQGITKARITITSMKGFTGTVSLAATVAQTGSNIPSLVVNPATVTLKANAVGTADLNINTTNIPVSVSTGYPTFNMTVTGTSGHLSHSASLSVTILDPQRCTPGFICPSFTDPLFVSVSQNTTTRQVSTVQVNNHAAYPINVYSYYYTDSYKVQIGSEYNLNMLIGSNSLKSFQPTQAGVQVNGLILFWQAPPPPPTLTSHSQLNQSWAAMSSQVFEALSFESYTINSGTNVTINVRNTGTVPVTFASYFVKDPNGDQYFLNSWSGPTISPTALVKVNILIGSSCPGCVLTGNPFTYGVNDPVLIVTSRNNQFSYYV
jgi:hypothetical protein